jgi:hypothetical protein
MVRLALHRAMRALLLIGALCAAAPAQAQVMRDDGMPIPWFRSRAENLAREACLEFRPECRDSVRRQLATEMAITRTLPWVGLALLVWAAVVYARRREQARQRHREEVARMRAGLRREERVSRQRAPSTDEIVSDDLDGDFPAPRSRDG